jgi:UDP-GlcNAc:undecaprenyl-phosphate/decaprenyl-phosphate GlcNAc-1-phosphate transferase
MRNEILSSLLAVLVAILVSSEAIPLIRRIALAIRAVDYPGGRREQAEGIPRLGGVAALLGCLIGAGTAVLLRLEAWKIDLSPMAFFSIVLALFIVFLCGVLEDTIGISPFTRILMQAAAALLVLKVGWCFASINLPFVGNVKLGILTGLISIVWIVGVTNAVNLLDGLDGLASGVVGIIAFGMLVFSLWMKDFLAAIVVAAILGACVGFLRKNWAPAQIYLGDSGSLTFGFLLALVSVRSSIKAPAAVAIFVPLLALGVPVIDTLLVMLVRFFRESRGSISQRFARMITPDRNHLHHLLGRVGKSHRRIALVIYGVAALFCGMALLTASISKVYFGIGMIVFEILIVFAIRQIGLHADALRISTDKRSSLKLLFKHEVIKMRKIA